MANYCATFSPTGGTEKVSRFLAQRIMGQYSEIDLCSDIVPVELGKRDVYIAAVPSYGGRVPSVAVERLKKITGS